MGWNVASAAMDEVIGEAGGHSRLRGRPIGNLLGRLPAWWPYPLIAALVLLIRLPTIGNPILDFDEQLYLLVGDRMLHGQLPYVDLWDRKPVGLFVVYAAIRMLGGGGIVQYQLVAAGCVAITAWFVRAIVRRHLGELQAITAALAYILILNVLHGLGGQTAIFYNALTAFAAWCACKANDTQKLGSIAGLALAAMLALGLAIQIKYTVIVEGAFFGCWFLWRLFISGQPASRLIGMAVAMVAVALAPTGAALGAYAMAGHLQEFVFANFVSIFQRHSFPVIVRHDQVSSVVACSMGLMAASVLGLVQLHARLDKGKRADLWLLAGWCACALAGFIMLGDFYDFYFLPVVLPSAIAAAFALRGERQGFAVGCLLLLWPIIFTPPNYFSKRQDVLQTSRMASALAPYVARHCLYVYDGPSILYYRTNACAPTRFIFPDHLTNPIEKDALGIDPVVEERRVLASKPGAIVTASRSNVPNVAPATQALVRDALARDYVLIARAPTIERTYFIWARRDLHPGPAPITDHRAANPQ
jgi:hypothetical protein